MSRAPEETGKSLTGRFMSHTLQQLHIYPSELPSMSTWFHLHDTCKTIKLIRWAELVRKAIEETGVVAFRDDVGYTVYAVFLESVL